MNGIKERHNAASGGMSKQSTSIFTGRAYPTICPAISPPEPFRSRQLLCRSAGDITKSFTSISMNMGSAWLYDRMMLVAVLLRPFDHGAAMEGCLVAYKAPP